MSAPASRKPARTPSPELKAWNEGDALRLFVGLPLSEACREELARLRAELKGIERAFRSRLAWASPATWHLTLKFIGDVPRADLPRLVAALAETPVVPFTLRPGGGGFFPSPRRPRVVWIGLAEGAAPCAALAASVDAALAGLGYPAETRPFAPHLTLARVKVPARDPWPELLAAVCRRDWPEVMVERFVLWKSELSPSGARHEALARFGPAGADIGPAGEREMSEAGRE